MTNIRAKLCAFILRVAWYINFFLNFTDPVAPVLGALTSQSLSQTGKKWIGSMLALMYKVAIPNSVSAGIVSKSLTITRSEPLGPFLASEVIILKPDDSSYSFEAVHTSQVTLSVEATDEAGLESMPVTYSFQALDTFVPVLGGNLIVSAISDRHIDDVVINAPAVSVTPETVTAATTTTPDPAATIVSPETTVTAPAADVTPVVTETPAAPAAEPAATDGPAVAG